MIDDDRIDSLWVTENGGMIVVTVQVAAISESLKISAVCQK